MTEPPTTPRLRRDARENRERVLVQAARVFAERGLDATLADVAKAAAVGVGTLYRHFPDKNDLILAVYADRMDAAVALAERSSRSVDPAGALREFVEHGARDFAGDRGFRELVLGGLTDTLGWSRLGPATALSEAIDRMNTAVSGHLGTLLERGKAAGALRTDLEPTDVQLINAAVYAVTSLAGRTHADIHQRIITMILDGVRPRPDGRPMPTPALTEDELSRAVRASAHNRRPG
jgi:AcrR family transcriptional regulator